MIFHFLLCRETITYAEIGCIGPGADMSKRVKWEKNLSEEDATDCPCTSVHKPGNVVARTASCTNNLRSPYVTGKMIKLQKEVQPFATNPCVASCK